MDQWLKTGSIGKKRTTELESNPILRIYDIPSSSTNLSEENPNKLPKK